MKCENCGKEHDGSYGSGRFCSVSCKQKFCIKPKKNKQYKCKFCGYIAESPLKLSGHTTCCKLNPQKQNIIIKRIQTVIEKNPVKEYFFNCKNCNKTYSLFLKLS